MLTHTRARSEDAFSLKLGTFAPLSARDRTAIQHFLARGKVRAFSPGQEVRPGAGRSFVILLEGFAYRYVDLPEGTRQILSFILPGDFIAPFGTAWDNGCLYQVRTTANSIFRVFDLASDPRVDLGGHPGVAMALWTARKQEENMLYQRMADLGRRPSAARVSAALCELYHRLAAVGLLKDGAVPLPLSQEEIGDAVGITTVHVNRVLQRLRRRGLIVLQNGELRVPDLAGLREAALWDPGYLLYRDVRELETSEFQARPPSGAA